MEGNIFEGDSPNMIDDNRDYFPELVGDDKPYKDPKSLAKSFMHKENHIKSLETTLQGLRDELKQRLTMEQVLDKLTKVPPSPSVTSNPESQIPGERNDANQLTPDKLDEFIEGKLSMREKIVKAQQNYKAVYDTLLKQLGSEDNVKALLRDKARELEVDPTYLKQMAETNPKVFLTMVLPEKKVDLSSPPKSELNSPYRALGNVKNQSYYTALRKNDPALYWSPKIQQEEHLMAIQLGEAFFQ